MTYDELKELERGYADITINPISMTVKPTTKNEKINANINTCVNITIESAEHLADIVVNKKYPIRLCRTNGGAKKNDVIDTQFIGLDCDNGTPSEIILAKLREYGLEPYVMYGTLSDTPAFRKTRIILKMTYAIKVDIACYLLKGLIDDLQFVYIQPDMKLDPNCTHPSRLWYPGTSIIYVNNDAVYEPIFLLDVVNIIRTSKDNMKTRYCKTFTEIEEVKNLNEKQGSEYRLYLKEAARNFNWKLAFENNKLLNDFVNNNGCCKDADRKLSHTELCYIASNLLYIEGGEKLYKQSLTNANKYYNTELYNDKKFAIITVLKHGNYNPYNNTYSPYKEDHDYKNIILSVIHPKGYIETVTPIPLQTLYEGEQAMITEIKKIKDSTDTDIHILICQTGLGKTEELVKIPNITLAVPRYDLMNEIKERMQVDYVATHELNFKNEAYKKELHKLYNTAKEETITSYIYKISAKKDSSCKNDEEFYDVLEARKYIKAHNNSMCAARDNKTAITTHNKAIFMDFKHSSIWFDEDPIQLLLQQGELKLNQLRPLLNVPELNAKIYKFEEQVKELPVGKCGTMVSLLEQLIPVLHKIRQYIKINELDICVLEFFNAHHYIIDSYMENGELQPLIRFIRCNQLPNKKIVICSATPCIEMWTKLYPDRKVIIHDAANNVELKGKVIQNADISCSRECLKDVDNIAKIKKDIKEKEIEYNTSFVKLTFKEFTTTFDANQNLYFGNCSGIDELKGKDTAVIGTPHLPHLCYMLYALALGIKFSPMDLSGIKCSTRTITFNGKKCRFNSYNDINLSNIQLELINDRLVQLIGRARALRKECIVLVYSNFPLKETTEYKRYAV